MKSPHSWGPISHWLSAQVRPHPRSPALVADLRLLERRRQHEHRQDAACLGDCRDPERPGAGRFFDFWTRKMSRKNMVRWSLLNEMWRNDMINIYICIYIYSWHFHIRTGWKLNAILMVHIYQKLMAYHMIGISMGYSSLILWCIPSIVWLWRNGYV